MTASGLTFLLNGEKQFIDDLPPTMTLLTYLRRQRRLKGTKEGCAEGDCGACTVVEASVSQGEVRYRAINACIALLAMLEGKAIYTVEFLKEAGGRLHPCQEAMADCHGSQCGFCTPGFVMSLFAAYLGDAAAAQRTLADTLAGNLCRCTGYGPILRAGTAMYERDRPAGTDKRLADDRARLLDLQHERTAVLEAGGQVAYSPASIDALADLLTDLPDARLVAGATDLGLWVTKRHMHLPCLIHVGRVPELRRIEVASDRIVIGAAATFTEAEPVLTRHIPAFGELLRRLGALQVRNSGTIGGNIANGSPIGDSPPALIVLDAILILRQGAQTRRLPLEDFFLDYGRQDRAPGEFVEAIEIPLSAAAADVRFYKVSKRFDQDISALCGCFAVTIGGGVVSKARIAFGGMAGIPKRARAVEAALVGAPWTEATVTAAARAFAQDFTPISDLRASAAYRLIVAENLLRRFFLETGLLAEARPPTRLVGEGAAFG